MLCGMPAVTCIYYSPDMCINQACDNIRRPALLLFVFRKGAKIQEFLILVTDRIGKTDKNYYWVACSIYSFGLIAQPQVDIRT